MRGSIRQRSKGSWEITLDIGTDPATGKRLRHHESVRGRKADAETKLVELLHSMERGVYVKPQRLGLGTYLLQWLDGYVITNCSPRTYDDYQSKIESHIIPKLGQVAVAQLQPHQIQQCYANLILKGRTDGKGGLSARTVLHVHRILFQALKYAVRQGLLMRNPAELVDPPRARKPQMRTLTPHEVSELLSTAKGTPHYPVIYTAIHTGLRQGELLGLRWRDLDLDLASLSVSQVLYKRRGACYFKEPKSPHSRRRLDLTPSLSLFLRQYRIDRQAERLLLGKPLTEDDLLFSNLDGAPLDPGTLTHNFVKTARRAGLQRVRFHDLRHTCASLMLLAGIHPKIVSEMLGHASVAFTLDVYSHVVGGLQKEAIKRLDKVLLPELAGEEKCRQNVGNIENPISEGTLKLEI